MSMNIKLQTVRQLTTTSLRLPIIPLKTIHSTEIYTLNYHNVGNMLTQHMTNMVQKSVLLAACVLVSSVASRRHLRSTDTRKLVVRRTPTVIGTRHFPVLCAVIWNSLPIDLRVSSLSAATFARHLKACLFRRPS